MDDDLPADILDETEENREAAASIEEEMQAEEENGSEEGDTAEERTARDEAEFSGMELEDVVEDTAEGENLTYNYCPREGNEGDDERDEDEGSSERSIPEHQRGDLGRRREEDEEEMEHSDHDSPPILNPSSVEKEKSIESNETPEGEDERDEEDEEEKEEEKEEEENEDDLEEESDQREEDGEKKEKEAEDEDDNEELEEEKEEQAESGSSQSIPEHFVDDIVEDDPIKSSNGRLKDDSVEDPAEDTVADPIEDAVEHTVGDSMEDNEDSPTEDAMENPVEDFVEDPTGDAVEDSAEDLMEDTREDYVDDAVGEMVEDPTEDTEGGTMEDTTMKDPLEDTEEDEEDEDAVRNPLDERMEILTVDESEEEEEKEGEKEDKEEEEKEDEEEGEEEKTDEVEEKKEREKEEEEEEEEMREEQPTSSNGGVAPPILQQMLEEEEEKDETVKGEKKEEETNEKEMEDEREEEEEDEDIQFLEMKIPAATLPLPSSAREESMQKMLPPRSAGGVNIQHPSSGSELGREQHQGYLLQQGGFQQIGIPSMSDSMVRRMKISGGIGSGGTVVISHGAITGTAPSSSSSSSSSSRSHPPPPVVSLPPSTHSTGQLQQRLHQVQEMQQDVQRGRRKRGVEEEKESGNEETEKEEFCFGGYKKYRPPVYYGDDTPDSWMTAEGRKVIRLDMIAQPTKVPSRERIICLDLRRFEGSEDRKDISRTDRIVSWRETGMEYEMAREAKDEKEGKTPSSRSHPVNSTNELEQRMKSPRPSMQPQTKTTPPQGGKMEQMEGSEIRPSSSQSKDVDKESHRAQVLQKIESARKGYAAAREASMMRMGERYHIAQSDGSIKEFVLAHLPLDQAQRPGFIQVIPEPTPPVYSPPPPSQPPVRLLINQRAPPSTSAPKPAAAIVNLPPAPNLAGADDLATRYAQYLAQMAARHGQE